MMGKVGYSSDHYTNVPYNISSRKDLNATEKYILSYIASIHKSGKEFFANNRTMGKRFGVSKSMASKTISSLVKKGLVERYNKGLDFNSMPKRYIKLTLQAMNIIISSEQPDDIPI